MTTFKGLVAPLLIGFLGVLGALFIASHFTIGSVEASGYDKKHQPKIAQHVSSTATTVVRRIRWNGGTSEIWIQNRDATNHLLISFDKEAPRKFWTIPANTTDVYPVDVQEVWMKSAAASVAFEMIIFKRSAN